MARFNFTLENLTAPNTYEAVSLGDADTIIRDASIFGAVRKLERIVSAQAGNVIVSSCAHYEPEQHGVITLSTGARFLLSPVAKPERVQLTKEQRKALNDERKSKRGAAITNAIVSTLTPEPSPEPEAAPAAKPASSRKK